jgi:hypothetical protein
VDLYIHSPIRLPGVVLNYLSTGTTLLTAVKSPTTPTPSTASPLLSHYYKQRASAKCQTPRTPDLASSGSILIFPPPPEETLGPLPTH